MNSREAWAWSTVARAFTEHPPVSVWDWDDLTEAIDYLNDRAYKAFKRSGDDQMSQAIVMVPNWTTARLEELLRATA